MVWMDQTDFADVDVLETKISLGEWLESLTQVRFGLAIALVLIATCLTLGLQDLGDALQPTLFLFFAAIGASAWFGGLGTGVLAVALSAPGGFYFYAMRGDTGAVTLDHLLLLVTFTVCAVVGSLLSSRQRRTQDGLRLTHRQLEIKARQLQQANDALIAEMRERHRTEQALHDAQTQLSRVARLTTMGELAASIAHEINQPLTAVATNAGSCLQWLGGDVPNVAQARKAAERIIRDSGHASAVIARIRGMLKQGEQQRGAVDVNAAIEDVLALVQGEARRHDVTVRRRLSRALPVLHGERTQLQQVIVNLITNAIEAMATVHTPRTLEIRSDVRDGKIVVAVQDTGPGLTPEIAEKVFEPFVTTKPTGMGLGLAICRSIVESHGGALTATSIMPTGALFEIALPQHGE